MPTACRPGCLHQQQQHMTGVWWCGEEQISRAEAVSLEPTKRPVLKSHGGEPLPLDGKRMSKLDWCG
eukprot:950920-Rhodomonas_salina.1